MEHKMYGNTVVIRLDEGDEIVDCVGRVCAQEGIRYGTITGLGGLQRMRVGVYDPANRRYVGSEYSSMFEIVSLTGNVTTKAGKPYLKCHLAAAYEEGVVVGGHLTEALVSTTAEVFITLLEGALEREFDEATGMDTLAL